MYLRLYFSRKFYPLDGGIVRSSKEIQEKLDRWAEKAREVLPLSRGGKPPKIQRYDPGTRPFKPLPKVKVFNERPFYDGEEVRWISTEPFRLTEEVTTVTRREEDEMQIELEELFNQLPTEGEQELAYMTLQDENRQGAQNQTLENALARMGARRPQQFQARARSNQFSRFNLVSAPKKKRKVSAYSKRFGLELKKLKKLHPRTKIQNLMKKAHRRTRAAMKKK